MMTTATDEEKMSDSIRSELCCVRGGVHLVGPSGTLLRGLRVDAHARASAARTRTIRSCVLESTAAAFVAGEVESLLLLAVWV